ncbi:MAG: DUF3995 domain-containing protein [bacterium]|nr:DUF3995 domain-containing protein [bacterium]
MPRALTSTLAIFLATVFALLCAFHVIGAFGVWVDLPVIPELPDRVLAHPSSISWLGVAAALALAVLVVLTRGDLILRFVPPWFSTLACLVLGAVFVLRSIGELRMFGFFRSITGTDFAFWDTWLYTPLCLVIGLCTLWLASTPRLRPPSEQRLRL